MKTDTDTLIIGCGIGGAAAALRLARDSQRHVTVVTRAPDPGESNTLYAQGGIVTLGPEDSPEKLINDVLAAGAGASLPRAAALLAAEGPGLVQRILIDEAGVPCERDAHGELSYTMEGGHSARRVIHAGDATGRAIELALIERLKALPNVELRSGATAVELITSTHNTYDPLARYEAISCHGAYVLDQATGTVETIVADAVVLATGGLGRRVGAGRCD